VVAVIVFRFYGNSTAKLVGSTPQLTYSDDDGNTWFLDDDSNLPPFDHHGKDAVRAVVTIDAAGKEKLLYLLRYTPQGKQLLLNLKPSHDEPAAIDSHLAEETEVKAPGQSRWVRQTDPRAASIMWGNPGGS
jgi:hypothetical protein